MPMIEDNTSNKPFLSIIGGKFKQKVTEDTPGAVLREYELSDKTTGSKWELSYKSVVGRIESIEFIEGEYGENCNIEFDEFIVSLKVPSDFFRSFSERLCGADVTKDVTLTPYDFTPKGETNSKRGMNVFQNDEKLFSNFWDGKTNKNGFPKTPSDEDPNHVMDKDDWKTYFNVTIKRFLKKQLEALVFPSLSDELVSSAAKEFDVPVPKKKEKKPQLVANEDGTISKENLPF